MAENGKTALVDADGVDADGSPQDRTGLVAEAPASLVDAANDYVRRARSEHTLRAYRIDFDDFALWCARHDIDPCAAGEEGLGLFIAALARAKTSVATIERRIAGVAWVLRQRGLDVDTMDPRIREVLAGIRRAHSRPPRAKRAISGEELKAMLGRLSHDLRDLRDRAILLLGFAAALRRSEIVGLDCGRDQSRDARGFVTIGRKGLLVQVQGKGGAWREIAVGRGSQPETCPVHALETWLSLARIAHGPLFRAVGAGRGAVRAERLDDKHVARLVKRCALAAGLSPDLAMGARELAYAGHSLRAGLATSAQVDEHHVQKQLGHASAEMTRRYRRERDRFAVNLTRASGL